MSPVRPPIWHAIRVGHAPDAPTVHYSPAPECAPAIVGDIMRQLALPIPHKGPPRPRTTAQGASARDKAGLARLTDPAKIPADMGRACVVRIVYESEEGDYIAVDSDPLTRAQADALASDCTASQSAAVAAYVLPIALARRNAIGSSVPFEAKVSIADKQRAAIDWRKPQPPPVQLTARLIALPHQIRDGVIRCPEELPEPIMELRFAA